MWSTTNRLQEIKKVGGLGWKGKMVVGWATDREIANGILIIDKNDNQKQLTAIVPRDELFNRLIAIGHQMWEAWYKGDCLGVTDGGKSLYYIYVHQVGLF